MSIFQRLIAVNKIKRQRRQATIDAREEKKKAKQIIETLSKVDPEKRAEKFILMSVEDLMPICNNETILNYILPYCKDEMERMAVLSIFNREKDIQKNTERAV